MKLIHAIVFFFFLAIVFFAATGESESSNLPPVEQGETTPPPTTPLPDCSYTINQNRVVQGRESSITVTATSGTAFSNSTVAELRGFGAVTITSLNASSLIISIPSNVALGSYDVLLSDPSCQVPASPPILQVVAPNIPQPTAIPPSPFPTFAPPSPVPGQPSLIVSQYSATPTRVRQGSVVSFTITVTNQGNRSAENVTAAFESSGSLVASGSQTSAIVGNIPVGGQATFVLSAIATSDAPSGTNNISLSLNYRDFQNNSYNAQSVLSVDVEPVLQISQINLRGYSLSPNPVKPGESVTLELTLTNTGTETASQLQLTVPVGGGVLLAGPLGNSFPLGSIAPRTDIIATLPLIVSSSASAGVQSQPLVLSFIQGDTPQSIDLNITLTVDTPLSSSILLESYDIGKENVQPGERFILNASLSNVGSAPVQESLISFRNTPTTNSNNNNPSASSSLFAPLGGGGSIFVGDIAADGRADFSQEFIVSASAETGIYSLPIQVRYVKPDGSLGEETLNASIVVLVPPLLRFIQQQPIPEVTRIGNTVNISLTIQNIGQREVRLLSGRIIAENFDLFSEDEVLLQTVRPAEEIIFEATVVPALEGAGIIRVELIYLDDFNQEAVFVQEYNVQILSAPPPPPTAPPLENPIVQEFSTPEPEGFSLPENFWGRLLLGLLGLGG